jgi:hypothetical protein
VRRPPGLTRRRDRDASPTATTQVRHVVGPDVEAAEQVRRSQLQPPPHLPIQQVAPVPLPALTARSAPPATAEEPPHPSGHQPQPPRWKWVQSSTAPRRRKKRKKAAPQHQPRQNSKWVQPRRKVPPLPARRSPPTARQQAQPTRCSTTAAPPRPQAATKRTPRTKSRPPNALPQGSVPAASSLYHHLDHRFQNHQFQYRDPRPGLHYLRLRLTGRAIHYRRPLAHHYSNHPRHPVRHLKTPPAECCLGRWYGRRQRLGCCWGVCLHLGRLYGRRPHRGPGRCRWIAYRGPAHLGRLYGHHPHLARYRCHLAPMPILEHRPH